MSQFRSFHHIPLQLPRDAIMRRLGYNRHLTKLTESQQSHIESLIEDGFSVCSISGRLLELPVEVIDQAAVSAEGICFSSASLAKALEGSHTLLIMAATAGKAITEKSSEAITAEDGVAGLVYDAVGSESADAALGWMQDVIRCELPRRRLTISKMRFSPGYGDLALTEQRKLYDKLKLDELGISITESCILLPEKSVTAIAGLIPLS